VDHLDQDRNTIDEYGLDLIRVLSKFDASAISRGDFQDEGDLEPVVEDIFNRADGLDKVLVDCWMELGTAMMFQENVDLHWPRPGVRLASMRGSLIA
jgi:hypothetical protein